MPGANRAANKHWPSGHSGSGGAMLSTALARLLAQRFFALSCPKYSSQKGAARPLRTLIAARRPNLLIQFCLAQWLSPASRAGAQVIMSAGRRIPANPSVRGQLSQQCLVQPSASSRPGSAQAKRLSRAGLSPSCDPFSGAASVCNCRTFSRTDASFRWTTAKPRAASFAALVNHAWRLAARWFGASLRPSLIETRGKARPRRQK